MHIIIDKSSIIFLKICNYLLLIQAIQIFNIAVYNIGHNHHTSLSHSVTFSRFQRKVSTIYYIITEFFSHSPDCRIKLIFTLFESRY